MKNVLLLNLIKNIYCIYEERLKKENKQDFNDMINITIDDIEKFGVPNKISYIIVDEFQDVSYSKVLLLKTLINKTKAKLVVVGDDWQSIYSFSGCDLNYFINFDKYFKNAKLMNINNIYRHSQELVDISKLIIAKNPNQIIKGKKLISKTHCDKPIGIYYYNDNIYETLKLAIKDLKNQGSKEIAIIGRNKSDLDPIESSIRNEKYENKCEYKDLSKYFDDFPVIFRTIHSSKGLEYDGVIIINMRDGLAGFPNKMQDDPILKYVLPNCNSLEEERRLFYVALTRTKTKTCILAPIEKTSIFIPEILETKPNNIIITKYKEPQTNYKTYYET